MNDCVDFERHHIRVNHFQKIIFMDVIDKTQIDQILPFVRRSQSVHNNNVVNAFLVEFPDESAADKPRASCNDNHLPCSFLF